MGQRVVMFIANLRACLLMSLCPEVFFSPHMHGVGKLRSRGQVLLVRSSTTSSSRRQCDGGGGSGLFSDSDSFYQLCQLSALPASILGLSEQTKTGATRGRGRQSRRKLMPPKRVLPVGCIQYTSRLVFAFF